jgi:peptidoglycan-associated lipoprotein
MKRHLTISTLLIFAFSAMFLISCCAKKQVVKEEMQVAPKEEVAKVEEPAVEEEKAVEAAEETKIESLGEIDEAKALKERSSAKFEAESVYFDFDKSFIRPEYRPTLEAKADFLKAYQNVKIKIEGNCDERGTNEYNLALGDSRAKSAEAFLVSLGISSDRIETISYGEERPLALGHNEESWSQNRRDDFIIMSE